VSQSNISSKEGGSAFVSVPIPIPDILEVPVEPDDVASGECRSDDAELCEQAFGAMILFLNRLRGHLLHTGSSVVEDDGAIRFEIGDGSYFSPLVLFRVGGAYRPQKAGRADEEYIGSWGDGVIEILTFLEGESRTAQPPSGWTEEDQRAYLSRVIAYKRAVQRGEAKRQSDQFAHRTPLPLGSGERRA